VSLQRGAIAERGEKRLGNREPRFMIGARHRVVATTSVLILPGLGGSGAGHWQSLWESAYGYRRVEQADWDHPKRTEWIETLERAVARAEGPVVLVAHSLACSLVAHFAQRPAAKNVRGALLVSPADVETPRCTPDETRCFSPIPLAPLPFPAHVVASSDDPYVDRERAEHFARQWHADFTCVGSAGHINANSNLGAWPEGHELLLALIGD
jgi:predicted alpha/beta hydrolase family esterase